MTTEAYKKDKAIREQRIEAINWTVQLLQDLIDDSQYLDNDPEFMKYLQEQLQATITDYVQPRRRKNERRANITIEYGAIATRQSKEQGSWTFGTVPEAAKWLSERTGASETVTKAVIYNMLNGRAEQYQGYTLR